MSESTEQVREKAEQIISRLRTDSAFKAEVENNPESTLVAAGLPANAVTDLLADLQNEASEVSGYVAGPVQGPSCTISCICTVCCLTI